MKLFDLSGKTALVTGATSGIGLAIVEAFVAHGARVLVSSEQAQACDAVAAQLRDGGGQAQAAPCDVLEAAQLSELAAIAEAGGGVDVLVVNAGGQPAGGQGDLSPNSAALEATLALNLRQAIHLTDLIAPRMADRGGGSIILMSSLSALRGNRAIGSYALAKAAMAQLARNLAVQWGPQNVRANAIAPGLIRTPFAQGLMDNPDLMERRLQNTPLRRVGEPHEIAGAAVFLAAAAGAFTTGHTLVVDGGTLITDGN